MEPPYEACRQKSCPQFQFRANLGPHSGSPITEPIAVSEKALPWQTSVKILPTWDTERVMQLSQFAFLGKRCPSFPGGGGGGGEISNWNNKLKTTHWPMSTSACSWNQKSNPLYKSQERPVQEVHTHKLRRCNAHSWSSPFFTSHTHTHTPLHTHH